MDRETALKGSIVVVLLLAAAGLIFYQMSGGKPAASEGLIAEAYANQDVESLKRTRLDWAAWLERAEAEGGDKKKIAATRDNITKLDKILRERGVDPETITADSIGPIQARGDE